MTDQLTNSPSLTQESAAEAARLEALARTGLMDTPPEQAFDDLVTLASQICQTSMAIVSFVDGRRQWFKAKVGIKISETSRAEAICAHTIKQRQTLIVPDTMLDPRFADHPQVTGGARVRFYAGVPLLTHDGHAIGTLCVIDRTPRELSQQQREALEALARQVVGQIELRQQMREIEAAGSARRAADASAQLAEQTLRRIFDAAPYMMGIVEILPDGDVLHLGDNLRAMQYIGAAPGATTGKRSSELGVPRDFIRFWVQKYRESRMKNTPVTFEYENVFEGKQRWMRATVSAIEGGSNRYAYFAEDVTDRREAEGLLKSVLTHARCILYQSDIKLANGRYIWHTVIPDENAAQRVLPLNVPTGTSYNSAWIKSWLNRDQKKLERETASAFATGSGVIRNEYSCRNRFGRVQWLSEDIYIERITQTTWRATGVVTDITTDKDARLKLVDALAVKKAIFDATPYIIVATYENGLIGEFNAAGERALGYTAEELIGKQTPAIFHVPEEVVAFAHEVQRDLNTAVPETIEAIRIQTAHRGVHDHNWTFVRKDGSKFPVHLTIAAIRDHTGVMRGFVGVAQDITERRIAERALATSEERLKFALESTEEGMWDWDMTADWFFFSPKLIEFYGYTEGEFPRTQTALAKIIHPDDMPAVEAQITDHFAGKIPSVEVEHRILRKDGTYVWMLSRGRVVSRDAQGNPTRMVGTHLDVTHRRQAKAALEEIRERLELALTGADLGFWDWNVATGRVVYNERWATMLGFQLADLASDYTTWERLLHPDDKQLAIQGLEAHFAGKTEQYAVELRMLTSSGDYKWILTRGRAVQRGPDGKPLRVAGTHLDIDDRKRAEAAAERARLAAQAASQAKSDFLANMSHEIRTPMTAIVGFADLLADPAVAAPARAECVGRIRRNADHLLNLLNDMLDVSKIEAGKLTIDPIPCSPVGIVRDVASMMRERASRKGILLETKFEAPLPATVRTDPTRVRQVLVNLVGNAIKFTETGSVRITMRMLDAQTKPRLAIDVADTGIGITDEQLSRLFEPFMQADASTSRKYGGTGLGLTISRRLAHLLGGEISAKSSYRHGSTFTFTLDVGPLDGPQADLTEPESPMRLPPVNAGPPLRARILVAEDGPDNRDLIMFYLARAGATVEVAVNGKVAVEMARAARDGGKPYDLIIMDIHMPELDGFAATRILKSEPHCPPIVALTANTMQGDREKCLEAGCDDFAGKPIDPAGLLTTLRKHLNPPQPAIPGKISPPNPSAYPSLMSPELRPLVDKFIQRLPARIAAIEQAIAISDTGLLIALAHQLKGAAGGYGFTDISNCAADLENLATASAGTAALLQSLNQLRNACALVS
jgi:PAS domain S-box-containing protein